MDVVCALATTQASLDQRVARVVVTLAHSHAQGLKFPIYRRYIGYRALSKRFLIQKIVCRKNREKSEHVGDIWAKYRILTEISVEISALGRHARVGNLLVFSGRYIGDIFNISAIYRRYFQYIGDISPKLLV